MAADRPNRTLADYVALAISPALLMGLVGSLVFFLLEVLYPEEGEYKGRLQWILFFFVFGIVLVARLWMSGVAGRAGLYGILLAGLTWIGMLILVEFPPGTAAAALSPVINLFLVGVAWWSTHKLTWDCTHIDEKTEIDAQGLLQATGLEKTVGEPGASATGDPPVADAPGSPGPEKKEERPPGFVVGWWERYQRYREERKKKRVLGGWVIYFSLAALPLFGLGEALIPAEQTERRQFAFWLMCAYVGCGLGLLATTCFLSLRRYLRQRRLQMPAAMTAVWLTAGGGLIAALLLIGALLPRPRPEYSLISTSPSGSDRHSASDFGQGGSSGKDQGNRVGDRPKDGANQAKQGKDSQAAGRDKGEPTQDKDKGDAAGQKDKDSGGQGQEKDKDGSGKDKQSSEKDKGDASSRPKGNDAADPNHDKSGANQQPPKDGPRDQKNAQQDPSKSRPPSESQGNSHPGSSWDWTALLSSAATVLKWIVFAVLILAVVYLLLREGLKFLANFTDWARNLLNALRNLFRGRPAGNQEGAVAPGATAQSRPLRPFSSYTNPFLNGDAERRPIKDLVRYTFDALQAWARERNVERQAGETPLEFGRRLGNEFPALDEDLRRLTILYSRAVYDYSPLPQTAAETVRRFWKRLETAAEQPLSA